MAFDGCLLVDKPRGMTSFDVVRAIKKLARMRKVGHTGTLDPEASGLLAIVLGEGTKLANYLILDNKSYNFEIVFGQQLTTDDPEGEVLFEASIEGLDRAQIEAALDDYRGTIQQRPPRFSAIRVDGRRAYDLAREGVEFELPARPVTVHQFELRSPLREGVIEAFVDCGSGTYIRSLARDLGQQLGCYAHARMIRRLRVGEFTIEQAHSLEEIEELGVEACLMPPARMMAQLPASPIDETQERALRHGQFIQHPQAEALELEQATVALDDQGQLVALCLVIEREGRRLLRPKRVLKAKES